jgi:glutathione S-transferase
MAQPEHTLVGESFSPFTQKARWALEYAGVPHRYEEYTPTLSEPGLRLRMRQWSGIVSVPVLFADNLVIRGSWEIARYASQYAADGRLGDFTQISTWNELSERALEEARTRVVRKVLANPAALDEATAAVFPPVLARPLRFVARGAARRLDVKYAHLVMPGSLRSALLFTRAKLQQVGDDFLLGSFSYADIAMCVVLEAVAPIMRTEPPLGPATRACWSDPALAEEFSDLLRWRERLRVRVSPRFSQLPARAV